MLGGFGTRLYIFEGDWACMPNISAIKGLGGVD